MMDAVKDLMVQIYGVLLDHTAQLLKKEPNLAKEVEEMIASSVASDDGKHRIAMSKNQHSVAISMIVMGRTNVMEMLKESANKSKLPSEMLKDSYDVHEDDETISTAD